MDECRAVILRDTTVAVSTPIRTEIEATKQAVLDLATLSREETAPSLRFQPGGPPKAIRAPAHHRTAPTYAAVF